jgi:hypothetical protein
LIAVGDAFPRARLPELGGGHRALAGASSRATLVVFGHADCATTKLALPVVDRLAAGAAAADVLCVLQEDGVAAQSLVDELALQLPVLLDAAPHAVSAGLELSTVPTLVAIGAAGVVTSVVEGYSRKDLELLAESVGMTVPLFANDEGPPMRPG